jgi:2-methylisocitrate lyase-like PEP mutase family enzyme
MLRFIAAARGKPCMANLIHGGLTPIPTPEALDRIGFKLAIFPLALLAASITAMQQAIAALKRGTTTPLPAMPSFAELQNVVGFPSYWAQEERFKV